MKNAIYKARITTDDNGKVQITSYVNNRIHYSIYNKLNEAVHIIREIVNGEAAWKEYFIRFEHDGHVYEQVNRKDGDHYCDGCVFADHVRAFCKHPHYEDGTKGNCHGLIYKKIK